MSYALWRHHHQSDEAPQHFGKPSRAGVYLAIQTTEFLLEHSLTGLAKEALALADTMERAAQSKSHERGLLSSSPVWLRQRYHRVAGRFHVATKNSMAAHRHLDAALQLSDQDVDSWLLLGQTEVQSKSLQAAAHALHKGLNVANSSGRAMPLREYVLLGTILLRLSRNQEARGVFLQGCDAWQSCSMWLGAGVALLRLDMLQDAEDALQEANIRNNENALVWGYICLLCMAVGKTRLEQANKALRVAQRLDLSDPTLLRELGNAYTQVDLLDTAEALFRRSLAHDPSPHTRRRLADVLSAQNSMAEAVNEYRRVISTSSDKDDVELAILQCEKLLRSLGRDEEALLVRELSGSK